MKRSFNRDDILEKIIEKMSEYNSSTALVGFVDVLGYSNHVKTEWLTDPYKILYRTMFMRSYLELVKERGDPLQLTDGNEMIIDRITYPNILMFSDSFIFIKEKEKDITTSLLAILGAIMELWSSALAVNFTLRGGIAHGDYFYSEDDIIGPAFIEAYVLESRKANSSRIVISDEIIKHLEKEKEERHPVYEEYLRKWIRQDSDGVHTFDPNILANTIDDGLRVDLITKIEELKKQASRPKDKLKYDSLLGPLNEAMNDSEE